MSLSKGSLNHDQKPTQPSLPLSLLELGLLALAVGSGIVYVVILLLPHVHLIGKG